VKVLILTLDTRGDVQPFVALPRGLANAGHEAMLGAPHRFEGFVRDSRVSLGGHGDTALVALGAEPGHLSRGEGPGDDVRPQREQSPLPAP
jgi:UDP:flavonoid glycosyltransferase YjiC (YdhE family)